MSAEQTRNFNVMKPDYYLSSLDDARFFSTTHECYVIKPVRLTTGREGVVVRVNPVVIGQQFGLGGTDIDYLVLICNIETDEIFPPSRFPCLVTVSFLLSYSPEIETLNPHKVMLGHFWCEIYKTKHDADNHIFPERY